MFRAFFMSSNVRIVSENLSQLAKSQFSLHSGSLVNGRVLKAKENNTYVLSLGGKKIEVRSNLLLKEGMNFKARLEVNGSTLFIKLDTPLKGDVSKSVSLSKFNPNDKILSSILQDLSLPLIPESFKLIQFALSMGIKLDSQKLKKALLSGDDGQKKSLEKSQTSLLLEEKGFGISFKVVEGVAQGFYNREKKDFQTEQDKKHSEQPDKKQQVEKIKTEDVKDYFEQVEQASQNNRLGSLTLFNSVVAKKGFGQHWLVLPFEWEYKNFTGVIRVLLSDGGKSFKKIVLNCENSVKTCTFVLYFIGNKVTSIKAAFGGGFNLTNLNFLQSKIDELFNGVNFEFAEFEELEGFATDDTVLPLFRGEA